MHKSTGCFSARKVFEIRTRKEIYKKSLETLPISNGVNKKNNRGAGRGAACRFADFPQDAVYVQYGENFVPQGAGILDRVQPGEKRIRRPWFNETKVLRRHSRYSAVYPARKLVWQGGISGGVRKSPKGAIIVRPRLLARAIEFLFLNSESFPVFS